MVKDIARQRLRRATFLGARLLVPVCAVAIGVAGCSSETSRFGGGGGDPGGNPYAARASYSASYAGPPPAAAPPPVHPVRYSAVESQPLPPPQPAYAAQPQYAAVAYEQPPSYAPPPSAPRYDPPPARYEPPSARYEPPPAARYAPPRLVSAPPPRSGPDDSGSDHSSAAGSGAGPSHAASRTASPPPARVATAPARAPASAAPAPVSAAPAPVSAAPAPAWPSQAAPVWLPQAGTSAPPAAGSGQTLLPTPPVHTVQPGDTLGRVAQRYHLTARQLALENGISPDAPLKVGLRLTIPGRTPAFRPGRPAGVPTVARAAADPRLPAQAPGRVVASEAPAAATVRLAAPAAPPAEAAPNGGLGFRWPARGRIINNYGARVNGANNDGIDLAVPEGTPVRSADDGVVAYAGNELKGYGNLVLVRHANGFVTAYANGSELLVKRNDQVHKGQVILKSGQTGNAAAPQLHFEIRKNSAPVDPMQYLPADRTASAPL
jgi:murein DD-endopeptidase MepM/ murein hydrolase activator NlpD